MNGVSSRYGFAVLHTDQRRTEAQDKRTRVVNYRKCVEHSLSQGGSEVVRCGGTSFLRELRMVSIGGKVDLHRVNDHCNIVPQAVLGVSLRKVLRSHPARGLVQASNIWL